MGSVEPKQLTPAELKALLAAVRSGEPYIAIAVRMGLKVHAVQKAARANGVYRKGRTHGKPFCVNEEATKKEIAEVAKRKAEIDVIRQKGIIPDLARPKGHVAQYVPKVYPDPRPLDDADRDWYEDVMDSDVFDATAIEGEEEAPRSWRDEPEPNSWLFKGKR